MAKKDDELDFQDNSIMTPLDSAAADLNPPEVGVIEATPVEPPQPMGAQTGTIYGPGGAPSISPETTSQDFLNAADLMNPFNQSTIEQVANLTGKQYPTDIYTGIPIPEQPVPAPAGDLGTVIKATNSPILQTVGNTKTERFSPTAGTSAALANATEAVLAADQAMADQTEAAAQLADLKGQVDQSRLNAATLQAQRAEELYQQGLADAETSRQEISRLRDQYANMKWDTYWGSKEAGDKIMLSLAVGMGAFAQSKIGGQNLAMALIQSNIDDHNKGQMMKFRKMESELTNAGNHSLQAQQLLKGQFNQLAATTAASYDQLDKQLEAISAKANSLKTRGKLEQMRAELRLKGEKDLFGLNHELDAKSTITNDIFRSVGATKADPTRFVTIEGKPMNEAQSKDYKFLLQGAPAVKQMEDAEATGLTNTQQYADARRAMLNEGRGGLAQSAMDAVGAIAQVDNYVNRVTAGNVALQNYFRNLRIAVGQKLRLESGASIAPSEFLGEMLKYSPNDITMNRSAPTQEADLALVRESRRNFLRSFRGASQSGNRLWFEGE